MKFIFSKIFLPGLFGLGGGLFLLTSCRTGERFNGWYLPWLAVAFSLFSRGRGFIAGVSANGSLFGPRGNVLLVCWPNRKNAGCVPPSGRLAAPGGRLGFSEVEWAELLLLIDRIYDDFTLRLQTAYPSLTEDAVRFCCY